MQTSTLKVAPMLCKFKFFASRMRQLLKFGKAKLAYKARHCNSSNQNNNYESENNNNDNSELSKLSLLLLTNEMAQNAANEWLLEQAANVNTAIAYAENMEPHVICLQTEAGHFFWNAAVQQTTQLDSELDWK